MIYDLDESMFDGSFDYTLHTFCLHECIYIHSRQTIVLLARRGTQSQKKGVGAGVVYLGVLSAVVCLADLLCLAIDFLVIVEPHSHSTKDLGPFLLVRGS